VISNRTKTRYAVLVSCILLIFLCASISSSSRTNSVVSPNTSPLKTNQLVTADNMQSYVDSSTSNVDGSPNIGTHSNFANQQSGPDSLFDTLLEANVNPPPTNTQNDIDSSTSDVDSSPDQGIEGTFANAQGTVLDSNYFVLQEQGVSLGYGGETGSVFVTGSVPDMADKNQYCLYQAIFWNPTDDYYEVSRVEFNYTGSNWLNAIRQGSGYSSPTTAWYLSNKQVAYWAGSSPIIVQPHTCQSFYVNGDSNRINSAYFIDIRITANSTTYVRSYHSAQSNGNRPGAQLWLGSAKPPTQIQSTDPTTQSTVYVSLEEATGSSSIQSGGVLTIDVPAGFTAIQDIGGTGWGSASISGNRITVSNTQSISASFITYAFRVTSPVTPGLYMLNIAFNDGAYAVPIGNFTIHVTGTPATVEKINLEYQWTTATFNASNEYVCIYTASHTGTESLQVNYWNGFSWYALGTISTTGWSNFTATGLTSAIYTIQLVGTSESSDSFKDSWSIDLITLHTWSVQTYNYKLDLELQWTSVNYTRTYEELCVYTGTLDAESIRLDVWTGSAWTNIANDLTGSSWNNFTIGTWLTSSVFTIRFRGDIETGDTVQSSWAIDCTLLHTWDNSAPQNIGTPSVSNIDDGTFMYANYRQYQISTKVSDLDGYSDIKYMDLTLTSDDRATEYWTVRFDEDTNVFSEQSDPSNYIVLDGSSSSASKVGNNISLTFYVTINWNHPDVVNTDAKCVVTDANPSSSTDYFEVNWDIETRLSLSSGPTLDDGSGTMNRGDVDGSLTANGTVTYLGSSFHPSSSIIDVWVSESEYGSSPGPWQATNYESTGGTFSATVYADDVVGLDTFTFIAVAEGTGAGGANLFGSSQTAQYIADRVQVQLLSSDDSRINANSSASLHVSLYYDYDDSYVTDGSVTVNGISATYSGSNGIWDFTDSRSTAQSVLYNSLAYSGGSHGISVEDMNGKFLSQIWDNVIVVSYSSIDSRVDVGSNATIDVTLVYAYDGTPVVDGTISINGVVASHQGDGVWRIVQNLGSVQGINFNMVVSSGNAYGITLVNQNSKFQLIIWDRVIVIAYSANDDRTNIGTTVNISVTLHYEYDNTSILSGTVSINSIPASNIGSGIWRISVVKSSVQSVLYNSVVSSGNAYGITQVNQNSQSQLVIWDQITVRSYSTSDDRTNVDDSVNIDVLIEFEYDDTSVTSGSVTINGISATYQGSGIWRITDSKSSVQSFTYNIVVCTGNIYGITSVNQNSLSTSVIWDRIVVRSYTVADNHVNIGDSVNIDALLEYEYDSSYLTDGLVTINTVSASYVGGGLWRITQSKSTVQSVTYDVVACASNAYGISTVNQNGKSQQVIWDEIVVVSYSVLDTRVDISTAVFINFSLEYKSDNSPVTDGTVTLNGISATHQGSGVWRVSQTRSTVQAVTYNTVVCSGNLYGISQVDQNYQSISVIWDQIAVRSYSVSDSRVNIDDSVDIDVVLEYEYDDTKVTTGSVTINGYSATHQGLGVWRITQSRSSVQGVLYNMVACSGNSYGITNVNQNSKNQLVIWDQITVRGYTVTDARDDVGDTIIVTVELEYEYDDSDVATGTVTVNSVAFTYTGSLGKWSASRMQSFVTSETYDTVVVLGNIYGITSVNQNSMSQVIIWDRIQVLTTTVDDSRVGTGSSVEIRVTLMLEYDSTPLGTGDTVTLSNALMTWDGVDSRFELLRQQSSVGLWSYFVNSSYESTYGISALNLNSQSVSVIWDRIRILTTTVDDARVNVNSNAELRVTAELAYDGHPLQSGDTIMMDSTIMTWDAANGRFYLNRTKATAGLWTFQVASASEATYGISTVDLNGQSQDVIWDSLSIDMVTSQENVENGVQVNFTMSVTYDYDLAECTTFLIRVSRNGTYWHSFTYVNVSQFYDTNSDATYIYDVQLVVSETTYDITVFSANPLTIVWGGTTAAPVNDAIPVLKNPDDSSFMYARLKFYIITSNVSDLQGYSDIDYVELSLWDNSRSLEIWRVRYTQSTDTFTIELGLSYIQLSSGSSYLKNGNDLDITWLIKIDWDHPDLSNVDVRQYVIDSSLLSDDNWYEVDWNVETRISYSVLPALSDNRGDINTNNLQCTGTVVYYGSTLHPLANETDIWILHDVSGTWSGDINGAGAFTISNIASSSIVRLNVYTIKVVIDGDGSGGSDLYYTASRTAQFITDRIEFYLSGAVDSRINANATGVTWWNARYEYDHAEITGSLIAQLNGSKTLVWNTLYSRWQYQETSQNVAKIGYSILSASESTYGLAGWIQSTSNVSIIWDQIIVRSYSVVDNRVNISSLVAIDVVLEYEYDSSRVTDGVVFINSATASHQGSGVWRISESQDSVIGITYDTVSCIGNGFNITLVNQNSQSQLVIWDRIGVVSYTVLDTHVNVDDAVNIDVSLIFEYDSSFVASGTVTINGYNASYLGSGVWRITQAHFTIQSVTYNVVECSGNAYGISEVNQNSQSVEVIWDKVIVESYYVSDDRVNVGDTVSIDVTLVYGYDNSPVTDGAVTINTIAASHLGNGVWRIADQKSSVQLITYDTIACSGNADGITNVDQNSQSKTVIWDQVVVMLYAATDSHVDINTLVPVNVTLHYGYDGSPVVNGIVIINSILATHIGSGIWQLNLVRSAVQAVMLNSVTCSGNSLGITSVDQNSQELTIIWDKITVRGYTISDSRVNVNDAVTIDVELDYEYDDSSVTDGSVTINGNVATHIGSGIWRLVDTRSSVNSMTYNLVVCSGNSYGISVVDQNSKAATVIWDQIIVRSYLVLDDRVNVNSVVNVDVTIEYDYDNSDVETGTVLINGISASYRGSGVWRISVAESTVIARTYDTVVCTGNAYEISNVNQNSKSATVIWDQVTVRSIVATDDRCNVGTTVTISITLEYEYDDSDVVDGLVIANSIPFSYTGSNGVWSVDRMRNSVVSELFNSIVISVNEYGITSVNQNGQSTTVIWDRIRVLTTGALDSRVNVNSAATLFVTAELEYDHHPLTGVDTIFLGSSSMTWDAVHSRFYLNATHASIGRWIYYANATGAVESDYGITLVNTQGLVQGVIWDQLNISIAPGSTSVYDFETVTFTMTVAFSYDSAPCTSYLISISRNSSYWLSFNYANRSLFSDSNSNLTYNYTAMVVVSDTLYGIVVFSTNAVQVTWSTPSNFVPTNNAAPLLLNPDDTLTLYARLRQYSITSQLLDYDGCTDIDYVEISLWDNSRSFEVWRLRYNTTSHLFSVVTGSSYIQISSGSSYIEMGYILNVTWIVKINWNHPDLQNTDVRQFVVDKASASDTDWYESNWKVETRLAYSTMPYLSDDRGNVGTINLQAFGKVVYYGSLLSPRANETDVWVVHDFSGSWSGNVDIFGNFVINNIGSSSEVRLNVYTFKIVVQGSGPASAELLYTTSATDVFITDRIEFYLSGVVDSRININTVGDVYWKARYQYDGTDVQSNLEASLNNIYPLTWDSSSSRWHFQETRSSAMRHNYTISAASESTYGITSWVQTAPSRYIIWDSLIIAITDPFDQRINVNSNASGISVRAVYAYDSTKYDGVIQLNNTVFQYSTVQRQYYTVFSVSSDSFGITAISVNDMTWCIWDQVEVVSILSDYTYLDPSKTARIQIYLRYDFDDSPVVDGAFSLKYENLTHIGDGVWEANVTRSLYQTIDFDTLTICDASGFGITAFSMYGHEKTIYWDRLEIFSSFSPDPRINVGATGFIMWSARLQNSGVTITSGLDAETNDGSPLVFIDGYWRSSHTLDSVGDATFSVTSAAVEGISFFTVSASDITLIWDRVRVVTTSATSTVPEVEQYIQVQATLVYEYDNTPVTDGVVSLWDQAGQIAMFYNISGSFWYANLTKVDTGNYTFYISAVSGNYYGISALNLDSHVITVQFVPPALPRLTPMMMLTISSGFGLILVASAVLVRKKYLVKVPYEIKQINRALKSMKNEETVEPLDVKDLDTIIFGLLEPGLIELGLSLEGIIGTVGAEEIKTEWKSDAETELADIMDEFHLPDYKRELDEYELDATLLSDSESEAAWSTLLKEIRQKTTEEGLKVPITKEDWIERIPSEIKAMFFEEELLKLDVSELEQLTQLTPDEVQDITTTISKNEEMYSYKSEDTAGVISDALSERAEHEECDTEEEKERLLMRLPSFIREFFSKSWLEKLTCRDINELLNIPESELKEIIQSLIESRESRE
jgi:hypothetical protein